MTQRNALSTLATPSRTHAHTTQRVESYPEIEPDSGPRLRAEFQSAVGHVARPTRNFVYVFLKLSVWAKVGFGANAVDKENRSERSK